MRRVAMAMLAGALGAALWFVLTLGGIKLWAERSCSTEGFQQLGCAISVMFLAIPVALLVTWWFLWLLRLRPAWPVAVVGPLFLLPLGWTLLSIVPNTPVSTLAIPVAYGVAAFVTDNRARPLWRVVASAVVVVLWAVVQISLR